MQTTEARRTKRGTPQGGVISPLLANLYFRRFLLAWHNHGHRDQPDAHVVNYADDFVICCRPGNAGEAMTRMTALMTRLGLEVNATKTRIARLPEASFDFLGYTVGRFHGKDGRSYFGTRPSRKAVKSLLKRIHQRTTRQWILRRGESPLRKKRIILSRSWGIGVSRIQWRLVLRYGGVGELHIVVGIANRIYRAGEPVIVVVVIEEIVVPVSAAREMPERSKYGLAVNNMWSRAAYDDSPVIMRPSRVPLTPTTVLEPFVSVSKLVRRTSPPLAFGPAVVQ